MKTLKMITTLATATMLLVFLFASCSEDNSIVAGDNNVPDNSESAISLMTNHQAEVRSRNPDDNANSQSSENENTIDDCFKYSYPISVELPDGSTQQISSDGEFGDFLDKWINDNPNATEFPQIQFPVTVTLQDGTTQTIENDTDLCDILIGCYDEFEGDFGGIDSLNDFGFCFELKYPITVVNVQGNTVSAANHDELYQLISACEGNNDSDTKCGNFVYPITIIKSDSSEQVMESDDAFGDALFECFGNIDDQDFDEGDFDEGDFTEGDFSIDSATVSLSCYDFKYPITLVNEDASTISVADESALIEALSTCISEEELQCPQLGFPVTLVKDDQTEATVNSEDELEKLLGDCNG